MFARLVAALIALNGLAGELEISRVARPWQFIDAVGQKAGLLGKEDGTLEAYVYPLKIFKDLRLKFIVDSQELPAASLARRVTVRPGSTSITYTGDNFRVTETIASSVSEPGGVITIAANTYVPVRIDVEFIRDFQLMWPAAIGSGYVEWVKQNRAFMFGADGHPFAAVLGSPDAMSLSDAYATNNSSSTTTTFTLGTVEGAATRVVAFAGSMKSRDEALATYRRISADPKQSLDAAERHYRDYLANTVEIKIPDQWLQDAYDWSRISEVKGLVDNPFLGRGLVAGYGPSKGAYRPGYAWFFGRDSFWTSFALTSAGDFDTAKAAIAFISKFQRDDGKIPHEISQSASFTDWFKQFPYGYASADATPLYAIAVAEYVKASGDVAFAREQAAHLWKALSYMRSTLDPNGFPKNEGSGHGWVEGGRLLPIRTELYQAGCFVEALRSLASIAELIGDGRAKTLAEEFARQRDKLNEIYWLPQSHAYAFAIGTDGKPVDQPSVLATVPMWFDVLDRGHAQEMIEQLSAEAHAADWGMRIISSQSKAYDPSGYHYGSVWPLFTGWASVGEYRNHAAAAAFANLEANAWLSLDGASGNPTEVLSGDTYTELSTASPHQIWSAAMVVSPMLRGLFGLENDAVHKKITFAPHLPSVWKMAEVHGVKVPGGKVDFDIRRDATMLQLSIRNSSRESIDVDFAPAYPPCAQVSEKAVIQKEANDFHPHFAISAKSGVTTFTIHHRNVFGYTIPFSAPGAAERSSALKVIAERWAADGRSLDLTVAGRAGHTYSIDAGDKKLTIKMADGDPAAYIQQQVHIPIQ